MAALSQDLAAPEGGDLHTLFQRQLAQRYGQLSPAGQRVARYIDENRLAVLSSSAADIAGLLKTSDATVIRTVQAIGFSTLADLRHALVASIEPSPSPAQSLRLTTEAVGQQIERAVADVVRTHSEALTALAAPEVQTAIARAVRILAGAERIFIFAIGPSAALADYAAFLMSRHGHNARLLNATGNDLVDRLLDLRRGDAILALAYGRPYPEVQLVFAEAERLRLPIVLITDSLAPSLSGRADVVVPAQRSKPDRISLHGVTVIVLEALILGLACTTAGRSIEMLTELDDLRRKLTRLQIKSGVAQPTPRRVS